MPERVTKEERMVSLAIEKARLAKEELSAKKRMNIEPTQVKEVDTSVEEVKIKRPKVQDASKITNQTQKKEGYGLAGESLKKQLTDEDRKSYPYRLGYALAILKHVHDIIKDKSSIDDLTDREFKDIKSTIDKHKDILDNK